MSKKESGKHTLILDDLDLWIIQDGLTVYKAHYPNSSLKSRISKLKSKLKKITKISGSSHISHID